MTTQQAQIDFDKLIAENGFTPVDHAADTGSLIYQRIWKKQEKELEIRIRLSHGYPLVSVKCNGKLERNLIRDYSSPKRAMNAIREIVRCAGLE